MWQTHGYPKPFWNEPGGLCRYLEENPRTRAVLSGGQGQGEQISEAEAMYRYLTEHGIDGSRLILEDRSTNTKENLDFSLEKIGTLDASIGIVTNHFHVFRGVAIGRKCRLQENLSDSGKVPELETIHLCSTRNPCDHQG